ncbi:hypothetical protein [Sphingobium baderi]|uniref:hypothetical protein n=1 Tax=Sphingobium baderi TaxID=1332080 RepID=UPI002B4106E9|nr:hypothetical protein [Sphingobium baderi]WRD75275.1 hypothetical protein QQ987_10740 [Sphingobium baderi]
MVNRIPITEVIRARLRTERDRTGIAPSALLRITEKDRPKDLSISAPGLWIRGDLSSLKPEHLEFVLSAYEACPTTRLAPEIEASFREKLQSEIIRTGIRPQRLLGASCADKPQDLRADAVIRWMKGIGPQLAESYLAYLLDRYAKLPDIPSERAPISSIFRQKLHTERKRTGISSAGLLKEASDPPDSLTANVINSWLTGRAKTARKDHMDWVIAVYSAAPDQDDHQSP